MYLYILFESDYLYLFIVFFLIGGGGGSTSGVKIWIDRSTLRPMLHCTLSRLVVSISDDAIKRID